MPSDELPWEQRGQLPPGGPGEQPRGGAARGNSEDVGGVGSGDIVGEDRAGHGRAEVKPGLVQNLRCDHFLHFAVSMGRRKGGCKGAGGEKAWVGREEGRKRVLRRNGIDLEELADAVVGGLGRGSKGAPVVEGALVRHGDDGSEEGGRRLGSEGNKPCPP